MALEFSSNPSRRLQGAGGFRAIFSTSNQPRAAGSTGPMWDLSSMTCMKNAPSNPALTEQ